jgi:hypothetical protein
MGFFPWFALKNSASAFRLSAVCARLLWEGKENMRNVGAKLQQVIGLSAAISGIYLASILLGAPVSMIFGLGFCAMLAIAWVAIRILKDPCSIDKTFDDYFYMDREDLRRGPK